MSTDDTDFSGGDNRKKLFDYGGDNPDARLVTGWGARILAARGTMSQAKLGSLIGRTQQTIGDWEREKAQPSLDYFAKLAEALNTAPEWLAFGIARPTIATNDSDRLDRQTVQNVIQVIAELLERKHLRLSPLARAKGVIELASLCEGKSLEDIRVIVETLYKEAK